MHSFTSLNYTGTLGEHTPFHLLKSESSTTNANTGIKKLSFFQVCLLLFDIFIEATWPISLMLTLEDGEYPYDPVVMQALSIAVACLLSIAIDAWRIGTMPSFKVDCHRLLSGAIAATLFVIGLILLMNAFRTATSGAAATCGFLALPIYLVITSLSAAWRRDLQEWRDLETKLSGITLEFLLIISVCAALFMIEDQQSKAEGIFMLLTGRFCICMKSYINGRNAGYVPNDTVSDASIFLFWMTIIMYLMSQPAAYLTRSDYALGNLIPNGWNKWTTIPFFGSVAIYTSNILVETLISGEMQAITGMSGRIIAMYIAFGYDVVPTSPIVLSVVTISIAVFAYMRLHYSFGSEDNPRDEYFKLHGRRTWKFHENMTY